MKMSKTSSGWLTIGEGALVGGVHAFYLHPSQDCVAKLLTDVTTVAEAAERYCNSGPLDYVYMGAEEIGQGKPIVLSPGQTIPADRRTPQKLSPEFRASSGHADWSDGALDFDSHEGDPGTEDGW